MDRSESLYEALYEALAAAFPRARRDRRDNVFIACPWCGKEGEHFSFSPRGAHCFVCGRGGSLRAVAERLGIETGRPAPGGPFQRGQRRAAHASRPAPTARPRDEAPPWTAAAVQIIAASLAHPGREAAWAAYKPLARATLNRHRFGLARLPFRSRAGRWYWSSTYWLTVPLFTAEPNGPGRLVGLRGRHLDPGGRPKWISATGSTHVLWNVAGVRPGRVVWLCENYVDAAWLMERHAGLDAVALGGAAHWREEWAAQLAARRPRCVVVALDNDLAGQAGGPVYAALRAARAAGGQCDPALNGPKIANSLRAAGLDAQLYTWPAPAPVHADVGWLLAQERGSGRDGESA